MFDKKKKLYICTQGGSAETSATPKVHTIKSQFFYKNNSKILTKPVY